MIADYFIYSFNGIRNRKLRSWMTVTGIFIGIFAVVSLLSLSDGLKNAINSQFESVGADRIIVKPGGGDFAGSTPVTGEWSAAKLYEDDLDVVKKTKGVDLAIGIIIQNGKVEFNDEVKYLNIGGVPTGKDVQEMADKTDFLQVSDGRFFKEGDRNRAIIGHGMMNDLFGKSLKVRDTILIKDEKFKVIGVFKKSGNPVNDYVVRIPIEDARELFDLEEEGLSTIMAVTNKGLDPEIVKKNIEKELREHRDVKEDEEDFTVTTSKQLIQGFNTILDVVQFVIVGIAAISLLVGGIGIMNTMYTSVLERTKEIGTMKAIGARNKDILTIFMIESGFFGLVGGFIGTVLGLLMSKGVEFGAASAGFDILKASVSPFLVIGALLFSFLVGCVSGIFPAMKAAKLKPVDALRYE